MPRYPGHTAHLKTLLLPIPVSESSPPPGCLVLLDWSPAWRVGAFPECRGIPGPVSHPEHLWGAFLLYQAWLSLEREDKQGGWREMVRKRVDSFSKHSQVAFCSQHPSWDGKGAR